jgi:ubiquinone/menaquinone biosynthesis C-methylase UbiE
MKLLTESELTLSSVVANSRTNRKRIASGINSYEKELGFKPEVYLNDLIAQQGRVKWLDLCCGEGKALIQFAKELVKKGLQNFAELKGIDLVDQLISI